MTESVIPGQHCACHSSDAYDCWQIRYPSDERQSASEIEMDGGPCQCSCHDKLEEYRHEEDYDPTEYL